jgi:hypothetical protein
MEDRIALKGRDSLLEEIKRKIRDPKYLQEAVQRLAGNLTREYYQRTEKTTGKN